MNRIKSKKIMHARRRLDGIAFTAGNPDAAANKATQYFSGGAPRFDVIIGKKIPQGSKRYRLDKKKVTA